MKEIMEGQEDTPPSSISGDEITGLDEESMLYLEEVEEYDLDDDNMDEGSDDDDTEMEPEDHAVFVFNKHLGSVFCCDLHPDGKMAVTGGEDDKAYVWCVETRYIYLESSDYRDSVVVVGFSHDGVYVAAADMSGLIKVYKCDNKKDPARGPWPVIFEFDCEDVTWGTWHFGTNVLIIGTITGNIYVFKMPKGRMRFLQGHNIKSECGKVLCDGVRLATAYEDGVVKIWSMKTGEILHILPNFTHNLRVTALDVHPKNKLIASISPDGRMVLTTPKNGKVVRQVEIENDLETVAFAKDAQLPLIGLGTLTGAVSIWDTSKHMLRHQCTKSDEDIGGVTKMFWIKDQLVTGCLDGAVRIYDGRTGERTQMLTGHTSEILDLCYNEKENIILTSSDDGTARIFKYLEKKEND